MKVLVPSVKAVAVAVAENVADCVEERAAEDVCTQPSKG